MSEHILGRLGLSRADFAPIAHALLVERDSEGARAMVTDRMLQIGVAGTAGNLIERLEGLVALGARHLSFGPPLGPDPLDALGLIGRAVIPHFH